MRSRFIIKKVSKELISEYTGSYVKVDLYDISSRKNYHINIGTTNKKAVAHFKPYFSGLSAPDKKGNRYLITETIIPEAIFEIDYYIIEKYPDVIQPMRVKFIEFTPEKSLSPVRLF